MATRFRYVVCDVFTNEPLAGNQLAVFTDARGIPEEQLQPLAKELKLLRDDVCLPAQGGRARLHAHLHAECGAPVRRAPDARHGIRARGDRCSSSRSASRPARGRCRSASSVRGARHRLRAHGPAVADNHSVRPRRRVAGCARRRVDATRRALRQRHAQRLRRARLPGRGGGAPARLSATRRARPVRHQLLRGRWAQVEDADVRGRGRHVGGSRDRIRCGNRSRCTSRATDGLRSGTRSRSRRAWR